VHRGIGSLVLGEPLSATYLLSFSLTVGGLAVYHLRGEPLRASPLRLDDAHDAGEGDRIALRAARDGHASDPEEGEERSLPDGGDGGGVAEREEEWAMPAVAANCGQGGGDGEGTGGRGTRGGNRCLE